MTASLMAGVLGGRFDAVVAGAAAPHAARQGGFNQVMLMAKGVSGRIEAPVLDKLTAVRRTRYQVKLSADERRANVAGAYAARGPGAGRVLLVDDVFTTGATLSECAGV